MNLVGLASCEHVIIVVAVGVLDVSGIEVMDAAALSAFASAAHTTPTLYKSRARVRAARVNRSVGEERRAVIAVVHEVLRRQVIPHGGPAACRVKGIVLVVDVIGAVDLHKAVGVVEPAGLGLDVERKAVGVGGDARTLLGAVLAPGLVCCAVNLGREGVHK